MLESLYFIVAPKLILMPLCPYKTLLALFHPSFQLILYLMAYLFSSYLVKLNGLVAGDDDANEGLYIICK